MRIDQLRDLRQDLARGLTPGVVDHRDETQLSGTRLSLSKRTDDDPALAAIMAVIA